MSNIRMVEAKLPPGFRFHPRDEELVCDYLMKKLTTYTHHHSHSSLLIDLDLNKCEPWDIPERACVGGKEWYFYTQRDRKYATGLRTNRATASGYWKATGKDKAVLRKGSLVGMRKTLVFYQGRAPKGKKTDWVMHEFRIQPSLIPSPNVSSSKEDWVLCRVFYKNREEIVKGSMGSIYDDDTAIATPSSQSHHLPQLMDSFISFEPPPSVAPPDHDHHDDDAHYEQVPCFSTTNLSSHHQNQTNPSFNHIMTMDHTNLGAPQSLQSQPHFNATFSSLTSSSNCSLDPFSCDTKVLKAVLTQLTKMEPNPTNYPPSHSNHYLSHHLSNIPSLWNNF